MLRVNGVVRLGALFLCRYLAAFYGNDPIIFGYTKMTRNSITIIRDSRDFKNAHVHILGGVKE